MSTAFTESDPTRLKKLIALTTSEHDNEALSALRAANVVLKTMKLHWVEVIDAAVETLCRKSEPKKPERQTHKSYDPDDYIEDAFQRAFSTTNPNSTFYSWLSSVHEQWEEKGFLSERQEEVLMRAAGRSS